MKKFILYLLFIQIFAVTSLTYGQNCFLQAVDTTDIIKKYYSAGQVLDVNENQNAEVQTKQIQAFIDQNEVIIFPNKKYVITDVGLSIPSNRVLIFVQGSQIALTASAKVNYEMLRLHSVENVIIYNAQLTGDKYTHLSDKGQWGFGISIRDAKNVVVQKGYIEKMWGDGVYIGQINGRVSSCVLLDQLHINDSRRNGISLTSCTNITIQHSLIENTKGQSPQCAIDIEPNAINDEIQDIVIKNNTTKDNHFSGILIMLDKFQSEEVAKKGSIEIANHTNNDSAYGISFYGFKNSTLENMSGFIKIDNFLSTQFKSEKYYYPSTNMSKIRTLWK